MPIKSRPTPQTAQFFVSTARAIEFRPIHPSSIDWVRAALAIERAGRGIAAHWGDTPTLMQHAMPGGPSTMVGLYGGAVPTLRGLVCMQQAATDAYGVPDAFIVHAIVHMPQPKSVFSTAYGEQVDVETTLLMHAFAAARDIGAANIATLVSPTTDPRRRAFFAHWGFAAPLGAVWVPPAPPVSLVVARTVPQVHYHKVGRADAQHIARAEIQGHLLEPDHGIAVTDLIMVIVVTGRGKTRAYSPLAYLVPLARVVQCPHAGMLPFDPALIVPGAADAKDLLSHRLGREPFEYELRQHVYACLYNMRRLSCVPAAVWSDTHYAVK